jgi:serine/threonine-protein kinase
MAVVVKARDSVLERPVAVKILSRDLAEFDEAREIFMTEARNLATLSHSNLVPVYDVDSEGGRPMMITEYVRGETLESVLQSNGALPQSTALRVGVQLSRAVGYLHDEGTIHRDLKPANIMLQSDGTLKVIDFGLARSVQRLADRGTQIRGTPAYMAPEQIRGDELGAGVDIYQIGVTLFETISGGLPFDGGDLAYAHVHEEPPSLGDRAPNVLPGLVDVVDACLAKDPGERPASAERLMEEFDRLRGLLTSSRVTDASLSEPNIEAADSGGESTADASEPSSAAEVDPSDESVEAKALADTRAEPPTGPLEDDVESDDSGGRRGLVAVAVLAVVGTAAIVVGWGWGGAGGSERVVEQDDDVGRPQAAVGADAAGASVADREPDAVGSGVDRAIPTAERRLRAAFTAGRAAVAHAGDGGEETSDKTPSTGGGGGKDGGAARRAGAGGEGRPTTSAAGSGRAERASMNADESGADAPEGAESVSPSDSASDGTGDPREESGGAGDSPADDAQDNRQQVDAGSAESEPSGEDDRVAPSIFDSPATDQKQSESSGGAASEERDDDSSGSAPKDDAEEESSSEGEDDEADEPENPPVSF